MRLWSFHPRYLDSKGLVALWREGLLAMAVLRNRTAGYRRHPQLERFTTSPSPVGAIACYLRCVHDEAVRRGYNFDGTKIPGGTGRFRGRIAVHEGQIAYEWKHFRKKLSKRNPSHRRKLAGDTMPDPHPLFRVIPGPVEKWEIV